MQQTISVRVEWALSICLLDVLKYILIPHLCAKDLNCVDEKLGWLFLKPWFIVVEVVVFFIYKKTLNKRRFKCAIKWIHNFVYKQEWI